MSGFMLHGLGDCAPERHCGCLDIPAMTATEPNPTAEHTDAVALMLADLDHYRRGNTLPVGTLGAVYRERAVRVLTSTDPAVHAAMLDALVRAGVLVRTTITANNATVSILAERIEVAP